MRQRSLTLRIIVLINVAVYLMWNYTPVSQRFMIENFLVSWLHFVDGRYWVAVTSVFSHNMLFHLLLNMMVLMSFAPPLEGLLGTRRFLSFYLLAGVVASVSHALVSRFVLGMPQQFALGASGAIAGLVILFSFSYPRQKLLLLGVIPIPALWGALAFVAIDLWGLSAQAKGGGLPIGHGAHLGGAFAGLIYYALMRKRIRRLPTV